MTTSRAAYIHRRPDMAIQHKRRPELNRCSRCGAERPEFYIDAPDEWGLICRDDARKAGVDAGLETVREATASRRIAEQEWLDAVKGAVASGQRVVDIADAAGISRERVYQIRDGRR